MSDFALWSENTFMKSIRRQRPPPCPAGLAKCSPATVAMWESHEYRFPPYQYGPQYLLTSSGQKPRVLDSSEREILLGYGPGHTKSCMSASQAKQSLTAYEDARCSLCGDSFAVFSFAIMGCPAMITMGHCSLTINALAESCGDSRSHSVAVQTTRAPRIAPRIAAIIAANSHS